eukprot:45169_1
MNNINNDKRNRMKTKDELYETNKRETEIEKKRKKMRTDSDQLFSKQLKEFATKQGQLDLDDEDSNKISKSFSNVIKLRSQARSKPQINNNNNNANINPSPPKFVSVRGTVPSQPISVNSNGEKHKIYEHIAPSQEEV